jgi:hypothetical protein
MSMPPWSDSMYTESFNYNHFTWEVNTNHVHYAGTHSVPIRYDLEDAELYELLGQINGAFFTGGDLDILLPDGTQH